MPELIRRKTAEISASSAHFLEIPPRLPSPRAHPPVLTSGGVGGRRIHRKFFTVRDDAQLLSWHFQLDEPTVDGDRSKLSEREVRFVSSSSLKAESILPQPAQRRTLCRCELIPALPPCSNILGRSEILKGRKQRASCGTPRGGRAVMLLSRLIDFQSLLFCKNQS